MEQKVITIGNSVGVIIPQALRDGIKPGDNIIIKKDKNKWVISLPSKRKISGGVDVKFMKMVDEFITEHEDVLQELAKR